MQLRLVESIRIGYLKAEADRGRWNCEGWKHLNCGLLVFFGITLAYVEVAVGIQPFGGTE